jgi:hypothetical protein
MLPLDRDALTVAMALVPGMYARNRLFSLYREPEVRRAKARAAILRGVVRQLAGAHGAVEGLALVRHGEVTHLRYRVPQVRLERRVELSEIERICLAFLAGRTGVAGLGGLHVTPEERAHLDAVLRRLGAQTGAEAGAPASSAMARQARPGDAPR